MTNPLFRLSSRLFLGFSRFRRGMTLGVRAAVFDMDGRVMLVRHSYTPGWYLPGGGVEPGEAMATALERELMEEGGIALERPAVLFGVYLNRAISSRDHVALFVSRDWRKAVDPWLPSLEIAECAFFRPEELPEGATAATRRRLDEIRGGAAMAAEW